MSARTFAEWQAYCSIEPFGPQADYWRAGVIASMIANVNRKKNQQPFTPEDFMPKSLRDEPIEGSASMRAEILKQNFEAYQQAQKATGQ
jgi:hypothetical protein